MSLQLFRSILSFHSHQQTFDASSPSFNVQPTQAVSPAARLAVEHQSKCAVATALGVVETTVTLWQWDSWEATSTMTGPLPSRAGETAPVKVRRVTCYDVGMLRAVEWWLKRGDAALPIGLHFVRAKGTVELPRSLCEGRLIAVRVDGENAPNAENTVFDVRANVDALSSVVRVELILNTDHQLLNAGHLGRLRRLRWLTLRGAQHKPTWLHMVPQLLGLDLAANLEPGFHLDVSCFPRLQVLSVCVPNVGVLKNIRLATSLVRLRVAALGTAASSSLECVPRSVRVLVFGGVRLQEQEALDLTHNGLFVVETNAMSAAHEDWLAAGDTSTISELICNSSLGLTTPDVATRCHFLVRLEASGCSRLALTHAQCSFSLPYLRTVDLSRTHVQSVAFLRQSPELVRVNLHATNISGDLSFLCSATRLERLDVSSTDIDSLEGVGANAALVEVVADDCRLLESLVGLRHARNLATLSVSRSGLRSLVGVDQLQALRRLLCSQCLRLEDVSQLRLLEALEEVWLGGCTAPGLAWSRAPLRLYSLGIPRTLTQSLGDWLGPHPSQLRFLDASRCTLLVDIAALSAAPFLAHVSLSHSRIRDVDALSGCRCLRLIDLSNCCELMTLEGLRGVTSLTEAHLDGTKIASLAPLSGCHRLRVLSVSRCTELRSLAGLESCSSLNILHTLSTNIPDRTALQGCPHLFPRRKPGWTLWESSALALRSLSSWIPAWAH